MLAVRRLGLLAVSRRSPKERPQTRSRARRNGAPVRLPGGFPLAPQAIACDFDRTLVGEDMCLRPRTLRGIENVRRQGIRFVVVTGRMAHSIRPYLDDHGIDEPVVCYQGAVVVDADGTWLRHTPIPLRLALEVIDVVTEQGIHLNCYVDDQLYVADLTPEAEAYADPQGVSRRFSQSGSDSPPKARSHSAMARTTSSCWNGLATPWPSATHTSACGTPRTGCAACRGRGRGAGVGGAPRLKRSPTSSGGRSRNTQRHARHCRRESRTRDPGFGPPERRR